MKFRKESPNITLDKNHIKLRYFRRWLILNVLHVVLLAFVLSDHSNIVFF